MSLRFVLPAAAVALALAAPAQLLAQSSSSAQVHPAQPPTKVRPAQAPRTSECDELMRQVEIGMPTAFGLRVQDAKQDFRQAQQLCNSGQSEEGTRMLRGILGYMHEGP